MFVADYSDLSILKAHFVGKAVISVAVADVYACGFALLETPAEGGVVGRHVELVPSGAWSNREYRAAGDALAKRAAIIEVPTDLV
jgi:hypothetical protein